MTEILFYIVTDNAERALADLFCSAPTNAPKWAKIVTDPLEILALPNGVKCRGQWYSPRGRTEAERAWRERRLLGGLDFISAEDEARINTWIDRRNGVAAPEKPAVAIARPEPELQNMTLSQRWT